MFKFLRTAEATLERAGLKGMTNGVLSHSELLFCDRGLRVLLNTWDGAYAVNFFFEKAVTVAS